MVDRDQDAKSYSRAFEKLVQTDDNGDDVVGLIAYALYKQAIKEEAATGITMVGRDRNPSATTVVTYRAAAEQLLTQIVQRAIDNATAEIQQSAILTAVNSAKAEVQSHVTSRTGFGTALFTNIVAWVITLAIAVLVLLLAGRPGVEATIVKAADRIQATTGN